jgi:Ribbon-helix-helix protein, copG family
MTSSVRQSVTLTKPQLEFLKREAERLGISVSDMIRRIIDAYREGRDQ